MSEENEAALQFCRDCLGWESTEVGRHWESIISNTAEFMFADLNKVLEAVAGWCNATGLGFSLSKSPVDRVYEVGVLNGQGMVAESHGPDACHALILACVAACQKLHPTRDSGSE